MSHPNVPLPLPTPQTLSANLKNDRASRWFDNALACLISPNVMALKFVRYDSKSL